MLHQRRIFATAARVFLRPQIGPTHCGGLSMSGREIPVTASGRQVRQEHKQECKIKGGQPMTTRDPESVALALVAQEKGILAADETVPTLTRRFDTLGIQSTEQSRRTYREMLFTCPGVSEFISGAIMYDETIRQKSSSGSPLSKALAAQGILPGIKVYTGAKPLAGSPGETVTEGLDGLRDRLSEYRSMGACFAKWRAVIRVTETLPSSGCVSANAHALGRYPALVSRAETRAHRGARSAYRWLAYDRALRAGNREYPSRGVP